MGVGAGVLDLTVAGQGAGADLLAALAAASSRTPVDVGFDPGMLHADGADAPARGERSRGDAALVEQVQQCFGPFEASSPVHGLVSRDVHGAELVARGDARGAQQRDGQAGCVDGVAALGLQCGVGALDGAPGDWRVTRDDRSLRQSQARPLGKARAARGLTKR